MRRRKIIRNVFLLVTLLQVLVFIFRDHFQYQPYATAQKLYAPCNRACVNNWSKFFLDYRLSELRETTRIADSVTVGATHTSTEVLLLGKFLYARFHRQLGRPDTSLLTSSPLAQYQRLSRDTACQLWCGNFAQMLAYFCASKGIVCRIIEIMKEGDHHVLNECYLPEMQTWVMVDLTHNLLWMADTNMKPLNTLEFIGALKTSQPLMACRTRGSDGVFAPLTTGRDTLSTYYQSSYPLYYYHRTDNAKAYTTANKLKQYFLPVSWYDILTPAGGSNWLFYVKDALALLWLLALVTLLAGRKKPVI